MLICQLNSVYRLLSVCFVYSVVKRNLFILDTIQAQKFLLRITIKEVRLKVFGFAKVHCQKQALYVELWKSNPITIDDEEVLVELSAFSATLTPRTPH